MLVAQLQAHAVAVLPLGPIGREAHAALGVLQRGFDLVHLQIRLAPVAQQLVVVGRRLDRSRVLEVRRPKVALLEGGVSARLVSGGALLGR